MSERLCLGRIKNIESYHLNISLLHGVKGRVQITDINLPYRDALEQLLNGHSEANVKLMNEMFEVGQIVRCSPQPGEIISDVAMKSKSKPVGLSLNPSRVNRNLKKSLLKPYVTFVGGVKSVEDNGYIIDTGISGLDVFLPYEETPLPVGKKYSIGCLVELAILDDQFATTKSRVLRCSMLRRQSVPDSNEIPFDSLLPGMRIPVKVTSSSLEGLDCTFSSFLVHIPAQHCPQEVTKYSPRNQLNACIVDIDLATKSITASLLPHFVKDDLKESEGLMAYKHVKVGAFVENAVLKRRERNCVYLWLPSFQRCGVLLKANAYGKDAPKKWTSHFPENTATKCRIIDFDLFLNSPMVSIRKNVLESPFLTLEDVKVGSKISVSVKKFLPRGVSVRLGGTIRGVIPYMHLSDVPIKNPQERFKIKSKIKAMVLGINHEKGELQLTAKKSLLSSSFPILGSANMLQSWEKTVAKNKANRQSPPESSFVTAYVIQSSEKGVLVCGMNNVRAWIPRSQTLVNEMSTPEAASYTKGETLQLRVLKRLQVSPQRGKKPSTQFLLSQIIKVLGLQVTLLRSAESEEVLTSAFLPYTHLSDSISIANLAQLYRDTCFRLNSILSLTEDGNTPARVVVVSTSGREGVVVSAKPSLLEAAQTSNESPGAGFLRSVEQLQVGTQWVGWVAHHMDYGTFVEFPGGFRGLVPTRYLCDRRAPPGTDWSSLLPPGTSVEAKMVEMNGSRFLLSLRMTDTYFSAEEQYVRHAVARTERYLNECRWICKHVKQLNNLSHFTMGQLVKFHVDGLTEEVVTG
ncbi:unnamed protein product, partial [Rodentolepis nana]|uniref:Programmed cell death 11 n=1 Tax=Rodentolepis nana TaxID=102285 RepID=A0A0R3T805_RODNA